MTNLMGYSVLVDNEEQAEKLQEIAIEQDFEWKYLGKNVSNLYARSFQFGCNGENIITYNNGGVHFQDEYITKKAHFNELFGTLEQQLQKAKAEVERLEKLINAKNELKRIQKLIESLENEI